MKGYVLWALVLLSIIPANAQKKFYLDCSDGNDAAAGTAPQTAWKTVAKANGLVLRPGDSLLLRRGSSCRGMLAPKGSGSESEPIFLGAYGTGDLPRVTAAGDEAALSLSNQQFWDIQNLDLSGGSPYGLHISGNVPQISHIHLRDLVVHDVTGQPKRKESGLVVISPAAGASTVFHDVVVDGVTAWGTTEWGGIYVSGAGYAKGSEVRGTDITIRNSVVHDVGGDGIFVGLGQNVLIERNVAWNTGMQYTESIGTPDGIWEWMCRKCTVQYNEAFDTDSPGVDGGTFDIDFGNVDNTVQYNFGHDSQGYCVSIFGAEGESGNSENSVIRRNVCVNNGRSPRLAQRQGAIYLSTWDGGKLKGVQVYGNTVYWNPPLDTAAIVNEAEIDNGAERIFRKNVIISTANRLVRSDADLEFSGNEYRNPLQAEATWAYGAQSYHELGALHAATGQEAGSEFSDMQWNALLQPPGPDRPADASCAEGGYFRASEVTCGIGALTAPDAKSANNAPMLKAASTAVQSAFHQTHGWTLLALLTPEGKPHMEASRSQMAVLQSMQQQFAPLGLNIGIISASPIDQPAARNWEADWNFGPMPLLTINAPGQWWTSGVTTGLVLISPEHQVIRLWSGLVSFPDVELTLRHLIGTPAGMQPIALGIQSARPAESKDRGR